MTWLDRLLIWHARTALRALQRRTSPPAGRVWWLRLTTLKPQRLRSGGHTPKTGVLVLGFGDSEAALTRRGALTQVSLTREMYDLITDGAVGARTVQDAQYAIVDEPR